MSTHGTFGTAINCIDGRTQQAVSDWVKAKAGVDFVDMVTEAGVDGVMAKGGDMATLESLKKKVGISVNAHKSSIIVIAGHHDCAGNPVTKDDHAAHIRKAVEAVTSWGFPVSTVAGLWVNDQWEVEQVC